MAQQTYGRSNLACSMILEDHLKKIVGKTGTKAFKTYNNKLLPKPQHSVFGNFPRSHITRRNNPVLRPKPLAAQE